MNTFITEHLWLIPSGPLCAAAFTALLPRTRRRLSAGIAIGSMGLALLLSLAAFFAVLRLPPASGRFVSNFPWFSLGQSWVTLGWLLDPLGAVMLVMVSFVGLLIFIYSTGYMAHDENFTRFFCFLSLFAAAMLGLILANSLLLLFIGWELVGLTSYLLIGFWYQKPSAAAAAKKAFITTRIGDLALFLGMLWLYSQTGTLLFYDAGNGCIEPSALRSLTTSMTGGLLASTAIGMLLFAGAVGKSGQVPLHVWLPDAMEGPTPVSALIHAATMVAAGVFLVARVYPLMAAVPQDASGPSTVLQVITWVGAITAIFAASIAVAQDDIKRILAYSTVSQLGYMMMGLGVGGVGVAMFHLLTHAFFKALLFLGAGSVIHGCHGEQDIRNMGGLRRWMPVTFATYAVGMLALSGFPLLFSGFWSKDAILHQAHLWKGSPWPFYLGLAGAFLTAFYMTRQVCLVFLGKRSGHKQPGQPQALPHESPPVMLWPLALLAVGAGLLGFLGTPAWPWLPNLLDGRGSELLLAHLLTPEFLRLAALSSVIVFCGIGLGWWLYARRPATGPAMVDPLEIYRPDIFHLLRRKYYVDEVYEWSVVRLHASWSRACDWCERRIFDLMLDLLSYLVIGVAWTNRAVDNFVVNAGFDKTCAGLNEGGRVASAWQSGRVQRYLRVLGVGIALLGLVMLWGCART